MFIFIFILVRFPQALRAALADPAFVDSLTTWYGCLQNQVVIEQGQISKTIVRVNLN